MKIHPAVFEKNWREKSAKKKERKKDLVFYKKLRLTVIVY